jgi:hypothetical protein
VSTLKELSVVILFLTLLIKRQLLRGRLNTVDYLFLANVGLVLLYAILPDGVLGVPSELRIRIWGLRFSLICLGLFMMGRSIPYNPKRLAVAVKLLVGMTIVIVAFGIIEFLFIPREILTAGYMPWLAVKNSAPDAANAPIGEMAYVVGFGDFIIKRMMSFFLTPLGLAYFLILPFALFLSAMILKKRWKGSVKIPLPSLIITLTATAIVLSLTRAVIAVALVMLALTYLGRNSFKAMIIVGVLGLIFATTFLKTVISRTVNLEDPSAAAHAYAYVVGIQNIREHPLGIGLGKAGPVAGQFGAEGMYSETDASVGESLYLSMTMERGFISLAVFLFFVIALARTANRLAGCEDAGFNSRLIGKAIFIATICFAVASISTEHWFGFQSSALFWWFAGIMNRRAAKLGL